MTRDEAIEAIRASVALGSATPTLGEPPEQYVSREALELEASVLQPVAARITGAMFPEHGLLQHVSEAQAFAIAHNGERWLVYLPTTGEFLLAYGPEPSQLTALGFRSQDALAEWLG